MKEDGGSAFPQHVCENCRDPITGRFAGMTLRDYFAGQALVGLLASDVWTLGASEAYTKSGEQVAAQCAKHAIEIADAMIAERKK